MFQGIVIDKDETGQHARLQTLDDAQLPAGNVTIRVGYSTLNYKDGLAITGKSPVVRKFPMVPGIDLVGEVEHSTHPDYRVGDRVVLNGWGVGETHWGGLAQKARVDGDWLVPLPSAFSPQQAMAIGTAGYTAMLCVMALERHGVRPDDGEIVVTGAAGGVGSVAIALLARLGYRVFAVTGRPADADYLRQLGAAEILDRSQFGAPGKPLGKERWAGAVDVAGSHVLANVCGDHTLSWRGDGLWPGRRHGLSRHRRAVHPARRDARRHRQRDVPARRAAGGMAPARVRSRCREAGRDRSSGRPGQRHPPCRGTDRRQDTRPHRRGRQRMTPATRRFMSGRRLARRVRPCHFIQETS
ncbi:hypothetical protein BCC0191_003464 [Burkholderia ambifaria]